MTAHSNYTAKGALLRWAADYPDAPLTIIYIDERGNEQTVRDFPAAALLAVQEKFEQD